MVEDGLGEREATGSQRPLCDARSVPVATKRTISLAMIGQDIALVPCCRGPSGTASPLALRVMRTPCSSSAFSRESSTVRKKDHGQPIGTSSSQASTRDAPSQP